MAPVAIQSLPQALPLGPFKKPVVTVESFSALAAALPDLRPQLSEKATIYFPRDEMFEISVKRFSDYKRPLPGAVVCVANEQDIVATFKWATANDIKFLARAGGHGWSTTLSAIGSEGIVINLRAINDIKVDMQNGTAALGAGATTGELLKAAQDANCHIVATACDSVGAVPSIMGGGIGNLVSNFGLGSDNMVSARLVTANGSVVTASPTQNSDLFWALRGAGHNYGIVTELTVKAYPQINGGKHWSGMLGFPGSKDTAKTVLQAIEDMGITKDEGPEGMSCTVVYGRPSPTFEPTVLLKLSFNGTTEAAMSAFAPLYAIAETISPSINEGELLPADEINESKDSLCSEGGSLHRGLRPVHSASLPAFDIATMGELYQRWEQFTGEHEGTKETVVRINCYDYRQVRNVSAEEAAFAWRQNPINVLQYWAYTDENMDDEIQSMGAEFRQALTGGNDASVIMSFASGDERPEAIYGQNVGKLRALKQKWDPKGAFSYYNSC